MELKEAAYLGKSIVRTVRFWRPKVGLYLAVFADTRFSTMLDTVEQGPRLAAATQADGLLVDTYDKTIGKGLLDYLSISDIKSLAAALHRQGREAWIADSRTLEQLPSLWGTGLDVICVRGAACDQANRGGRFGRVRFALVRKLVATARRAQG